MLSISIGTVIWSTIAFLVVLLILAKTAWKPILKMLRDREDSIENALQEAEKARQEMSNLRSDNEKLLQEAREERDNILKEAREVKENIISEAKKKAGEEGDRLMANAKDEIENQKRAALQELKSQVASLSIEIAEKVIREHLSDETRQKELVNNYLEEAKLN
ncbi:F0F1 ATP synthase subunit B [Halocola ammonii]